MPYPGPAIIWPPINTLIQPDPETGHLPGVPCPGCGATQMTAIVLHHHGTRLVSLCCTAPTCTATASPAAAF